MVATNLDRYTRKEATTRKRVNRDMPKRLIQLLIVRLDHSVLRRACVRVLRSGRHVG